MKKLIPADTVDAVENTVDADGNLQEAVGENTNNLIPADTVDAAENVGENTNNLIPADTVDAKGHVWETVGENIRNGIKNFSIDDVKAIVDILFPVGSVLCGENNIITSVGRWEQIVGTRGNPIILSLSVPTGGTLTQNKYMEDSTRTSYTSIRIWKRIG